MLNNQEHSIMLIDWRGYHGKKSIESRGRRPLGDKTEGRG